jgi:hypothetical protein
MQVKDGQLKEVILPHLPPKRLTRSLAAEFVEKRKSELQGYHLTTYLYYLHPYHATHLDHLLFYFLLLLTLTCGIEYVRDIIKITALIQSEVVIKFLDVPHSVRPMLFAVGNKKDFSSFEAKVFQLLHNTISLHFK